MRRGLMMIWRSASSRVLGVVGIDFGGGGGADWLMWEGWRVRVKPWWGFLALGFDEKCVGTVIPFIKDFHEIDIMW